MTPKIEFNSLAIEVTRRCNMHCDHCMRGEPQNKDVSRETIETLLQNTESILDILFTGGEISLNTDIIKYTLELCKKYHIPVYGFYIVTNGKEIHNDFLCTCIEWYSYVIECGGDTECCGLALSKDMFHESISYENQSKLQAFSFFREDKFTDFDKTPLLNLGRAHNISGFTKREKDYDYEPYVSKDINNLYNIDDIITVTVDGDILSSCDYEYNNTDNIKIGSVYNPNWITEYYNTQNE